MVSDTGERDLDAAIVHLGRWAAAAKAADAADSRTRQQRTQQLAQDEATLAATLAGLAERRAPVAVHTRSGATVRGEVVGVGADFVAVAHGGQLAFLAGHAIDWIRPDGPASPAAFADPVETGSRLVTVLAMLAEETAQLRVVMGTEAVVGDLVAVGVDVLTLRPAGAGDDQLLYVPAASVSEVSLRLSG